MESESDAAKFAILFTVAISRIDDVVHILRVERDETKAMGYELVRQHRCICLYLHQVYCHCGDLSKDSSTQGIREREVNVLQFEIDMMGTSL
jgi:hypothetical protein